MVAYVIIVVGFGYQVLGVKVMLPSFGGISRIQITVAVILLVYLDTVVFSPSRR